MPRARKPTKKLTPKKKNIYIYNIYNIYITSCAAIVMLTILVKFCEDHKKMKGGQSAKGRSPFQKLTL